RAVRVVRESGSENPAREPIVAIRPPDTGARYPEYPLQLLLDPCFKPGNIVAPCLSKKTYQRRSAQ
ncbi:MAG: hypothetical protein O3C68_04475, partial [Proteobacteria bacterium]|nr:hypothetical protein [Pseudomonadota bacterium]